MTEYYPCIICKKQTTGITCGSNECKETYDDEYGLSIENKRTMLDHKFNGKKLTFNPKYLQEIHLGYAGTPMVDSRHRAPFIMMLRIITSQGMHLHTYGHCSDEKENKRYLNEEKRNKFFHYHEGVAYDKLPKEISQYDFGLVLEFVNDKISPLWGKTTMANKLFDYIAGGIPVICSSCLEYMKKFIDENGIGFTVNFKEFKNLRNIIKTRCRI